MRERFLKATRGARGDVARTDVESGGAWVTSAVTTPAVSAASGTVDEKRDEYDLVDLSHRRDELRARVAELQWDLGGLVYEMAIRDRIRVDILVKRAAILQDADAELAEVERILRMEETATAGACSACGAPHSSGAAFCWQCGSQILRRVDTSSIMAP